MEERKGIKNDATTLVYGEIKFEPFAIAIEKIKRKYGGLATSGEGTFYDIGSGTGKPVFAAVLMHTFKRAVGIEILASLHDAALKSLTFWNKHIEEFASQPTTATGAQQDCQDASENTRALKTAIEFFCGDITKFVVLL